VVDRLSKKGVKFSSIIRDTPGAWVGVDDPDGNAIYLWEVNREAIPEPELVGSARS
jgi:hypothetical protein